MKKGWLYRQLDGSAEMPAKSLNYPVEHRQASLMYETLKLLATLALDEKQRATRPFCNDFEAETGGVNQLFLLS